MGVMTRIQRVLKANLHDMLDRAEDPATMLNYLIIEMQESLEQAREETALAMAAEKRLAQQASEADHASEQWKRRAHLALKQGQEDLAREALRKQLAAEQLAVQYAKAHAEQSVAVAELRNALDLLQMRLRDARARRASLLAQLQATHAQQVIAHSLRQTIGYEAFDAFDRIAGTIASRQQYAVALTELNRGDGEDTFLIAEEQGAIEHRLHMMKQELGYLESQPEPRALEDQGDSQ